MKTQKPLKLEYENKILSEFGVASSFCKIKKEDNKIKLENKTLRKYTEVVQI